METPPTNAFPLPVGLDLVTSSFKGQEDSRKFADVPTALGDTRLDQAFGALKEQEAQRKVPSIDQPSGPVAQPDTRLGQALQAFREQEKLRSLTPSQSPPKTPPLSILDQLFKVSTVEQQFKSFKTAGIDLPHISIFAINGMATSYEGARSHADYLTELAGGHSVNWIYNRTNSPPIDAIEILSMNYLGYSPNTAAEMKTEWTNFHLQNLGRPNAKCLHFCHSQGAIHTRNALADLPEEIRNRVIVVAIAPGAIVPRGLCFESFNYACKGDIVPFAEFALTSGMNTDGMGISKMEELALERLRELILLDPLPGSGNPHDFQNPTFKDIITDQIQEYLKNNGEYKTKVKK